MNWHVTLPGNTMWRRCAHMCMFTCRHSYVHVWRFAHIHVEATCWGLMSFSPVPTLLFKKSISHWLGWLPIQGALPPRTAWSFCVGARDPNSGNSSTEPSPQSGSFSLCQLCLRSLFRLNSGYPGFSMGSLVLKWHPQFFMKANKTIVSFSVCSRLGWELPPRNPKSAAACSFHETN